MLTLRSPLASQHLQLNDLAIFQTGFWRMWQVGVRHYMLNITKEICSKNILCGDQQSDK